MKVYIGGKMRGMPNWNLAAFDAAAQRWRDAGHQVFCPADITRALGYEGAVIDRALLEHSMQIDLQCIYAADAIALLPGWEDSSGVAVELALAQFLDIPVYHAITMTEINPPRKPWSLK